MKKTFRILDIDFKVVDKNRVEVINPDSYAEYLIGASDGIRANIYALMKDIVGVENMPEFIDIKVGKSLFRIGYNGELWEKKKANINEIIKKIAEELEKEPIVEKTESTSEVKKEELKKEVSEDAPNEQIKKIEERFLTELSKLEQEFSKDIEQMVNEAISKKAEIESSAKSPIAETVTPKFSDVEKSLRIIEDYLADINDPILNMAYDRVKKFLISGIPKETDSTEISQESIPVSEMTSSASECINKIIKIAKELAYEEVSLDEKKVDELMSVLDEAKNLNLDYETKEMMSELKKKLEEFKKKEEKTEKEEAKPEIPLEKKEEKAKEKTEEKANEKKEKEIKEKASIKKKAADVKEEFKKIFEEESTRTRNINEAVRNTMNKLKEMGYDVKTAKDIRKEKNATFKVGEKVWLKDASIKDDTNFGIIQAISNGKAIVDWGNEIPTEESLEDLVREDDYKVDFNINLFTNSSSSNGKIIKKDTRFDAELARISFKDKFNDIQKENDSNRIKIGKFEGNIIKDNDGKLKIQIGDKVLTFFKYHIL
jgi:hypothetical protein